MDGEQSPLSGEPLDRRRALMRCAGWGGTAALFTMTGGIASSVSLDAALAATSRGATAKPFTFLQISDTHIGFDKAANPNARGTSRPRAVSPLAAAKLLAIRLSTGSQQPPSST